MALWGQTTWGQHAWSFGGGGAGTALEVALGTGDAQRSHCAVLRRVLVDPVTLAETLDTVTLPLTEGTLTQGFRDDWLQEDTLSVTLPDPTGTYLPDGAHADYVAAGTRYQLELTRTSASGTLTTLVGQYRLPARLGPTYDHQQRTWTLQLEDMWRGRLRGGASGSDPTQPDTWSYTDIEGAVTATLAAIGAGLSGEGLNLGTMGALALGLGWYITQSAILGRQRVHVDQPWASAPYPTDFTHVRVQPVTDPNNPIPQNRDLLHIWTGAAAAASFVPTSPAFGSAVVPPVQVTFRGDGDWVYRARQTTASSGGYGVSCDPADSPARVRVPLPAVGISTQRHRPAFNRCSYELVVLLADSSSSTPSASTQIGLLAAVTGWAARYPFDPLLDETKVVVEKTQATGPSGSYVMPTDNTGYVAYCQGLLAPVLSAADRVTLTLDPAQPPPPLGTVCWLNVAEADVRGWYRLTRVTWPLGSGLSSLDFEWAQD